MYMLAVYNWPLATVLCVAKIEFFFLGVNFDYACVRVMYDVCVMIACVGDYTIFLPAITFEQFIVRLRTFSSAAIIIKI